MSVLIRSSSKWLVLWLALVCPSAGADSTPRTIGVGFFEGGAYPAHAEFRNYFRDQLKAMAPAGVEIVYLPDGFKSAEWDRGKSRAMAAELAGDATIDLVLALGPWTVEDLLAAGFDRPIIAALRFDPAVEGLVNERGRAIVDNLTVRLRPRKVEGDFRYLAELTHPSKIGVLYFPTGNETASLLENMRAIGRQLGFEIVTAEGYDTKGTFAFFKAYRELSRSIDALYLPPLWGLDAEKMQQFYAMVGRDGIPAFSSEGMYHVARSALAAGSIESALTNAHFHAWKAVRIIEGTVPADLPNALSDSRGLIINGQMAAQLAVPVAPDRRYDLTFVEAPAPDEVERLTVIDAVGTALTQNPGYQAVYAALEAAEHIASEAWSAYLPQMELSGAAAYFDDNAVHNDARYDNHRYRARLSLNQEIFSLEVIRDIRIAALERDQSEIDRKQASADLELAVTAAYLDLVRVEQVRSVEQVHLRQVRDCLQLARLRNELGEAEAREVWRWEQEWLLALQAVRGADAERNVARVILNTLLGRPGDYAFVADWRHFVDARFFSEEAVLARFGSTAEQRDAILNLLLEAAADSPELAGSELAAQIGRSRLDRNRAGFWPRVGFFASLDVSDELAEPPGVEEANPSWSVGAEIRLPLFWGGQRFRERRRLQAELDQRLYQKDQVSLETTSRLRTSLERALSRVEEFPLVARAAELADQIFPETLTGYASGRSARLDLLDAVHNDRRASRQAIETQIDYYQLVAELMRAAGISPYESGRTAGEELISRLSSQSRGTGR